MMGYPTMAALNTTMQNTATLMMTRMILMKTLMMMLVCAVTWRG